MSVTKKVKKLVSETSQADVDKAVVIARERAAAFNAEALVEVANIIRKKTLVALAEAYTRLADELELI